MIDRSVAAGPPHVGIIMDGNRRWAAERGQLPHAGHAAAAVALSSTVNAAVGLKLKWLTVYSFSTENWTRSTSEVSYLVRPDGWLLPTSTAREMHARGVRIRVLGDLTDERLPAETQQWSRDVTAWPDPAAPALNLCVAFNYGGRQELQRAARLVCELGGDLSDHLWCPEVPELDLIIRTSGEQRLSNFMLWQSAYAELMFTSGRWPDFTGADLAACLAEFAARDRRQGGD